MDIATTCALVTLVVLLGGILVKLSGTLSRLDSSVKELTNTLHEQKKQTDRIRSTVANHESRILILEDHIGRSNHET